MALSRMVLVLLCASTPSVLARKKDDAVLLSKVKSLTLRNGHETSHRRVSSLPQLKCVGGNGCQFYEVDVMRCTNSGSEYDVEDIQWTCKAQTPSEFKLGSTEVICEGYDSPNDPFVLKGSCGVEYRLMLTGTGEEKYKDHIDRGSWRKDFRKIGDNNMGGGDGLAAALFWLIFAAIILAILYSIFKPNNGSTRGPGGRPRRGFGYNGGGGGGDDGFDDPPPPYSPRGDPRPKKPASSWSNTSRASSSRSQNTSSSNNQQEWRPGFWSGTAAGAAAGYAAGSYANRNQRPNTYAQPGRSGIFGTSNTSPLSGFGAGPSNYGSSNFRSGPSSSVPEPSSSRQESTGFGGTRRR